ncbi:MAG: thioredoxin domain-containing protein [Patescibacteria group bacterium]
METPTPSGAPDSGVPVSTQPVLTKEMKDAIRSRQQKSRKMKELLTWLIPAILVLGGVFWLVMSGGSGSVGGEADASAMPTADDRVSGQIGAKVSLVEYGDFQCPACAAYFPAVKQIKAAYPNDVVVAYRHFPLVNIHPLATPAAIASEAANAQGKFWEMHDMLYENQQTWVIAEDVQATFRTYAEQIGLDMQKYDADFKNAKAFESLIIAHMKSGGTLQVTGTPSFFLNGKRAAVQSPQQLLDLVVDAVGNTPVNTP